MDDYKTCANDHLFDRKLDECPHCKKPGAVDKTIVEDKTEVDNSNNSTDPTAIEIPVDKVKDDKTAIYASEESSGESLSDRTVIHHEGTAEPDQGSEHTHGRKLVGWLVSFTWNKEGQDYQLREGKTLIGANDDCDISIGDNEVSGKHATILYRNGKFRIRDEMSTNGTKINDEEDLMGDHADLNDGDTIIVGKTEFLFRSI